MDAAYNYSPEALKKVVYAGAKSTSFEKAADDLRTLAEMDVSAERVRRATTKIGDERAAERDALTTAYEALPIPDQRRAPANQPIPKVVVVQMDGGRMQILDRQKPERNENNTFWREMKVGFLLTMLSEVSAEDPCPDLPKTFVDPEQMRQLVREIKGFCGPEGAADEAATGHESPSKDRPGRPKPLARSIVATRRNVDDFGKLLVSEAYWRGFAPAERKAFVADGSEANWGVWRTHFSTYTPILDFIHALTYIYSAAMAGQESKAGWQAYREWAQAVWSGRVVDVIAALELRQQALGAPTDATPDSAPAAVVAKSLGYLRNQQSRMNYPDYRKQGLPIVSSYVESAVKLVNRRVKGTEKFWGDAAEAVLTLVGDHLSDTPTLAKFWRTRHERLNGSRCTDPAVA